MEIKDVLYTQGFKFNKALGQNFITDKNLLSAIAADSGVGENDTVVEIGTGAGTLTCALSDRAKRVVSFEVDRNLEGVLAETLKGRDNIEVVMRDVLKMKDDEITDIVGGDFLLVANLPYYVTTPIITRFLFSPLPVKSLTVMVQKEVAERITASPGDSEYSAISASVQLVSETQITRIVSRKLFYPSPKVDSAVIKMTPVDKYTEEERRRALALIKQAFLMRRKTLYNNLKGCYPSDKLLSAIRAIGLSDSVRGENLSPDDYVRLGEELNRS